MSDKPTFRVLVIGGGIGGTALALAIGNLDSKLNIETIIFERDTAKSSRHQGVVIGLRQESVSILTEDLGCVHLAELFNADGPKNVAMIQGDRLLMRGSNWLRVKLNGGYASSMIDRSILRQAMIDSLPVDRTSTPNKVSIQYGKRFVRYEEDSEGVTVFFEDGTSTRGDILVGCDGEKSPVRSQRCHSLKPDKLDLWTTYGSVPYSDVDTSGMLAGESRTSLVRSNGTGGVSWLSFAYISSQQDYRLLWSISLPSKIWNEFRVESEDEGSGNKSAIAKSAGIAKKYINDEAFAIILKTKESDMGNGYEIVSVTPELVKSNPLSSDSKSRVTLLGDAAHKTTTHAGLGATAAILDAVLLTEHIRKIFDHGDPVTELRSYEVKMSAKAARFVGFSLGNTKRIHDDNPNNIVWSTRFMVLMGSILSFTDKMKQILGYD